MPSTRIVVALVLAGTLALAGAAHAQSRPIAPVGSLHGAITDRGGAPISDVTVLAKSPSVAERLARTDANGRYVLDDLPADRYTIIFVFGNARLQREVTITPGALTMTDAQLDLATETITIKERKPPRVLPQPVRNYHMVQPPYSDEAIDKDVWATAWLVLDIDPTGNVAAVRFVKSAGYGLDEMAVDHAFTFHFRPARDEHGHPVESTILWKMEWPPYWRAQMIDSFLSQGTPPCKGSGPMRLDSVHPVYRDCAVPDLATADVGPWVTRPRPDAAPRAPMSRPTTTLAELPEGERTQLCHWVQTVSGSQRTCDELVPRACRAKVSDLVTCTLRSAKDSPAAAACAPVAACSVTPAPPPPAAP